MGKIVDWADSSYQDIQNLHSDWDFLRFDFSFSTIASTATYLTSAVALDELATWKQDSVRAYLTSLADQSRLDPGPWDVFRDLRQFGVIPEERPTEFSIKPDKSIVFWPTPNDIFTITGEYWKRAQTMTANVDEPLIPSQFQMAIVWKAVQYYAADQGAAELYATAEREYMRLIRKLELHSLPKLMMAGPLA